MVHWGGRRTPLDASCAWARQPGRILCGLRSVGGGELAGTDASEGAPLPDELLLGRRRSGSARRTAWVVVDQALASASNFGVTVIVARESSANDFGRFALAMAFLTLATGVVRGAITQPLTIRFATEEPARQGGAALGGTLAISLPVSASLLFAAVVSPSSSVLCAFAFAVPFVLLQDTVRFVWIAQGAPERAALNDLVWCIAQVFLIAWALTVGDATSASITVAWALAAVVACAAGFAQLHAMPSLRAGAEFVREHLDLGGRLACEFLLQAGTTQVILFVVAAQVGAEGVGAIRGSQTLFGVYFTLFMGVVSAATTESARALKLRPHRLTRELTVLGAGLAGAALAWGSIVLAVPDHIGRSILGDTWEAARELTPPMAVGMVALGLSSGAFIGLRVLEDARGAMRVRVASGVVAVAVAVLVSTAAGADGAAWAIALGHGIAGVTAWLAFRHRLAVRTESEPEDPVSDAVTPPAW